MSDAKHYTFGDNELAAGRLKLLAEAYGPSTKTFLERLANEPVRHVVDLGCGPGYTTALLGMTFPQAQVLGIDSSTRFITRAREHLNAPSPGHLQNVAFEVHDVTIVPFPGPPAELIFGRFILTHLAEPRAVLRAWAEVARVGARLALEETIALESPDPLFQRYYAMVAEMQRSLGQSMNIGAEMGTFGEGTPWRLETSVAESVQLEAPVAARLHALNIQTWRHQAFVRENYSSAEVDEIAAGLSAVANRRRSAPAVVSHMRQIVLRRAR
jgi:trans-aconitate methyltransferase